MKTLQALFENNRKWANDLRKTDPEFFLRLARQQTPEYLWIGCADSRVPANEIVGLPPGELFVHRNVANLVLHTDMNCLSVIQYAVDFLKVKHIIVCGHYGCGGVHAALDARPLGLVDNWLRHIRDLANQHRTRLDAEADEPARRRRLCELNVIEQVIHVAQTTILRDAWGRGQPLTIHGWIYDLSDGLLRDLNVGLCSVENLDRLQAST
jgi:carbonic anhydrase